MPPSDVLTEVERLSVAYQPELTGNLLDWQTWRFRPVGENAVEERFHVFTIWSRKGEANLKAPPNGAV